LIGPNDCFGGCDDDFVEDYENLLQKMYDAYVELNPDIKIINVVGGSGNGLDPLEGIQEAIANWDYPNVTRLIVLDEDTW